MFYLDLFRTLNAHDVRYMLVGGLAMNLHGVPRMTMDVDIVLEMDVGNLRKFLEAARELTLAPGVPVDLEDLLDPAARRRWREEKHHLVAFPLRPREPRSPTLDLILEPALDVPAAIGRAEIRDVGGIAVPIASLEDMIQLKENAGREQDHADLVHLLRIRDR